MAKGPFHVLVAGLAKSGTTILFTRIQAALPGPVAVNFEPWSEAELSKTLAGGGSSVTKILLGGEHWLTTDLPRRFDRHVLVVRDPRDRLLSLTLYYFYLFKRSGDLAGFIKARELLLDKLRDPEAVSALRLCERIEVLLDPGQRRLQPIERDFEGHHRRALDHFIRFAPFLVRYEGLVDPAGPTYAALSDHLGHPVPRGTEVDPEYHRVVRSRTRGQWRSWLTPEDLELFQQGWTREYMEAFGYPPAASGSYDEPLPVSTTIDYVDQFRPVG